jgi:hypothetical protein
MACGEGSDGATSPDSSRSSRWRSWWRCGRGSATIRRVCLRPSRSRSRVGVSDREWGVQAVRGSGRMAGSGRVAESDRERGTRAVRGSGRAGASGAVRGSGRAGASGAVRGSGRTAGSGTVRGSRRGWGGRRVWWRRCARPGRDRRLPWIRLRWSSGCPEAASAMRRGASRRGARRRKPRRASWARPSARRRRRARASRRDRAPPCARRPS